MNIGFTGYIALRRDLMQPIDSPDRYFTLIRDLKLLNGGEHIRFIPLKHLKPGCETPPDNAEADEIEAHTNVIHYGNCLKPLIEWTSVVPVVNRWNLLNENPFDWSNVRYQMPFLDAIIIEATSQIGAGYSLDLLLQKLYNVNPNIGFVIMDCDLAAPSVFSKMKKWHPDPEGRTIFATYYTHKLKHNQAIIIKQHLAYRQMPNVYGTDPCYVGNDYDRRPAMERFFKGPRFHWYGRCKSAFRPTVDAMGVQYHGSYEATPEEPLECAYRRHGIGINFSRELYYRKNFITARVTEIIRSGCLMFVDEKLKIIKPIIGDWCCVKDGEDVIQKIDTVLANQPQFWCDMTNYQQAMACKYMESSRHTQTLWECCKALQSGSLRNWYLNYYDDLCKAAGVRA